MSLKSPESALQAEALFLDCYQGGSVDSRPRSAGNRSRIGASTSQSEDPDPLSNSLPGTSSASRTLSQLILSIEEIPLSSLSAPRLAQKIAVFREGYLCC